MMKNSQQSLHGYTRNGQLFIKTSLLQFILMYLKAYKILLGSQQEDIYLPTYYKFSNSMTGRFNSLIFFCLVTKQIFL